MAVRYPDTAQADGLAREVNRKRQYQVNIPFNFEPATYSPMSLKD
ncbi:MAG: hypothetical protein U0931_35890 [Vulcanimicrobiota bacterium]